MVVLETLEWSDMYSYGPNNKINFTDNKITQLTAPNGSGKTSISLIIQELLYSKNIKKIKKSDILHRHSGAKGWSGNLTFKSGPNEYLLKVSRTGATSKVSLFENGKDISEHKVPDTYKKLKELVGLDFEIFTQLTYQSSKDLLDFLLATDAKRKQFLVNLFQLNKYIEIGENVKFKLQQAEKQSNKLEGELDGVNRFLDEAVIPEIKKEVEVPTVDEQLKEKQAKLRSSIETHKERAKQIDRNNILKEERDNLKFDLNIKEFDYQKQGLIQQSFDRVKNDFKSKDVEITKLKKRIKDLDTADTCYACGQPLDNSHSIKIKEDTEAEIAKLREEQNSLLDEKEKFDTRLKELVEEKRIYEKNKQAIERFETLSQLVDDTLPSSLPNVSELESELRDISTELNEQEKNREEARQFNEKVRISNTKVEALVEQRREFLARQKLLEDDIIAIKSKVSNLTILRKAFSSSGIVAYKLENLTKELEDAINSYLAELSDGQFHVVFRLTGEKLNIVVVDEGKESPIETVSGGEFSRIQTAVLLAIRKLLSKIGGNYVNLLFLDEITGVLDDAGKEKLIDVLREEENLNVFLISHDFTHPLINKISIVKENKISRIEEGE